MHSEKSNFQKFFFIIIHSNAIKELFWVLQITYHAQFLKDLKNF